MEIKSTWLGIDFGTTNSAAVSIAAAGKNMETYNHGDDMGTPFPSIVGINKKNGDIITGRDAKDRRNELSEEYEFFTSVKSILDQDVEFDIAGKKWTPVDIAAEILSGLKENIKKRASKADNVVMAVPVGFSPKKKAKLRLAAKKAGISIESFISEPTAAFCGNYAMLKKFRNVAVFDWGGGTLDVAILRIENGRIHEVATDGINIAGDNIDKKIAEYIHSQFCVEKNESKSFDEVSSSSKDRLLQRSELCKIHLSEGSDVERISIMNYDGMGVMRQTIDYDFFEELVEFEVDEALTCLERTISKSNLNMANIGAILCVGGSSRLRPFKKKLIEKYGEEKVIYPKEVMWNIAEGAAFINMSNTTGGYGLNQDLGLIMSDGSFHALLHKGQPVPCKEKVINFASVTDEKSVRFLVTDAEDPKKRTFQHQVILDRKGQGFMSEQFEVSCFIDPDLLFRFRIRSTEFMKKYLYLWTYDKLNIFYEVKG